MYALITLALATGCLGTSPEEEARDALGVGEECERIGGGEGPEHCPGEPCLACHSEDYHPGEASFILAGTVYDYIDDTDGRQGVTISFVDAELRPFTVTSNRTGNFMVSVDHEDGAVMREDGRGRTWLPFRPTYPLSVGVITPEVARNMRSYIWREGSCAYCHDDHKTATSTGHVYVQVRE